ncbi:carboxypeptidase-like regulatory domain-containing protein [Aurantibacter sp.]|uniref:carboxypeptidase-like regulatory domain-containing protein n=1 Tax=Aurantibacter sp. TaxID=2807103 RepID=UPI0035C7F521
MLKSLKYTTIALIFGLMQQVNAQVELKNKVVDFMSFAPIENASVYVQNTTIGSISNSDGKFVLLVPQKHENDTLVISSIGFKSFKAPVKEFDNSTEIFLEEDVAELDEIVLIAENRPKTGSDIVLRALKELPETLPDSSYLQKGFVRHKERNKREFKWLVESAITLYDEGFQNDRRSPLKIHADEVRKSYDLRDVDSLLTYTSYLKNNGRGRNLKAKDLDRSTIKTSELVKAIKWNDTRVNGMESLFNGKLNLMRNSEAFSALFDEESVTRTHHFKLDTVLVENGRKLYKIEISKGLEYIDLKTKGIFNGGFNAKGWIYIYWDNFAVKKVEYELIAASAAQKSRSKTLFDTYTNHKLVMSYMEYNDRMYLNYVYYETPKLVNVGSDDNKNRTAEQEQIAKENRYYYTVQEILFTEILEDKVVVNKTLSQDWDPDIFAIKPYNKEFWKNYNVLLESEEEEQLIQDLTQRSSLYKN